MSTEFSRRSLLAALVAPPESARYLDSQTEHIVTRLTRLDSAAVLPAQGNHFLPPREKALYFASDRDGAFAAYRMDLRSGTVMRLSAPSRNMQPRSLALINSGRALYFRDNGQLQQVALPSRRQTQVSGAGEISDFRAAVTLDDFALLRGQRLYRQGSQDRVYSDAIDAVLSVAPDGRGCLFLRGGDLWLAEWQSTSPARRLAQGPLTNACWSPTGRSVLYLRGDSIQELMLETGREIQAAKTSRFVSFSLNADGTVFVGASASKAQPFVLLLLRSVQRELPLCEHRASDAALVSPTFSPDSRRVYFESDGQGRPAIYSVNVETLVEPTS